MTEAPPSTGAAAPSAPAVGELGLLAAAVTAAVAGAGLALAARHDPTTLLVAIAVVQGLLAVAWIYGTALPGPRGALVIAALAAAGADVAVSRFPHGRLGAVLIVLALAVPVIFVHQLVRGAARSEVVASMSGVALLVVAEVALPSLEQLGHEFQGMPDVGGEVVAAAVGAVAAAIVVGALVDLLAPVPRFDPDVPRGLLGLVAATAVGAALGYLLLETEPGYGGGAGAFLGGALGALAALVAVGTSFAQYTTTQRPGFRRVVRTLLTGLLPLCLLAPVAFLVCLAVRT